VTVEVFREGRAILVESIWWDARRDELVWVDITAGTLHRGRLDGARDGSDDRVVRLEPPLSCVQPARGGGYVAASADRIVALDAAGAVRRTISVIAHPHSGLRLNEGKVDPFGALVIGSMNTRSGRPDAALYRVTDEETTLLRGGFGVTNGLEWIDDGGRMLVTDTAVETVYAGSYDASGALGELSPLLVGQSSDGLTRAQDGTFWNGIYGGGVVGQWSATGEVLRRIEVPAPHVTSVAFGGPDFDALFVGTARENLEERELERWPLSGAIFRIDGIGRGFAPYEFGRPGGR